MDDFSDWAKKFLPLIGLCAMLIAVVLLIVALWQQPDGRLHLWMLDVGQGDALLIQTPHGRKVLVDGGPDQQVLAQQLASHIPFWDRSIDLVVSTHPDLDHINGLIGVLDSHSVSAVLQSPYSRNNDIEIQWRERLAAHNLTPQLAQEGQVVDVEPGVTMQVDGPPTPLLTGGDSDSNNASVVLRLTYGTVDMLLTGDIGTEGVATLLRDSKRDGRDLRSEVLKVPHHGSATGLSPAFLAAVQPDVALISVGKDNTYGHPAPTTIDLLLRAAVPVLRTDKNGAIEVLSDGQQVWVAPERK